MVSSNSTNKIPSHSLNPVNILQEIPKRLCRSHYKTVIRKSGKYESVESVVRNFATTIAILLIIYAVARPVQSVKQKDEVSSQNLANYWDTTSWKTNDLTHIFCNTPVTGKNILLEISKGKAQAQNLELHAWILCSVWGISQFFYRANLGKLKFHIEVISLLFQSYLTSNENLANTCLQIR